MTVVCVLQTLNKVKERYSFPEGMVIHTDFRSQYTASKTESWLEKIKHSYSRKGAPYDNAEIESFHASLKAFITVIESITLLIT